MKHKWHKEIQAWSEGAEIEVKQEQGGWIGIDNPGWYDEYEYRIKPQPKEPDFDATEYQRALKKSAQKFKEKIERTYAEVLDKAINELAQPSVAELNDEYLRDTHVEGLVQSKEPQYLYVYKHEGNGISFGYKPHAGTNMWQTKVIGKIKLEVDDDM